MIKGENGGKKGEMGAMGQSGELIVGWILMVGIGDWMLGWDAEKESQLNRSKWRERREDPPPDSREPQA